MAGMHSGHEAQKIKLTQREGAVCKKSLETKTLARVLTLSLGPITALHHCIRGGRLWGGGRTTLQHEPLEEFCCAQPAFLRQCMLVGEMASFVSMQCVLYATLTPPAKVKGQFTLPLPL